MRYRIKIYSSDKGDKSLYKAQRKKWYWLEWKSSSWRDTKEEALEIINLWKKGCIVNTYTYMDAV